MKDTYKICNLLVGNGFVMHSYSDFGPTCKTSNEKFIVEKFIPEEPKKDLLENHGLIEFLKNIRLKLTINKEEAKKNRIDEVKYAEVFTGGLVELEEDISKDKFSYESFGPSYIVNAESITNYLTQGEIKEGYITKYRLLQIYNDINFQNKKALIKKDYSSKLKK